MKSRVTSTYQTVVPKALRQQFKISPGTILNWTADGETLRVAKFQKSKANRQSRITAVAPWPKGALAKAYKRVGKNWDSIEAAGTAAQGVPSWED